MQERVVKEAVNEKQANFKENKSVDTALASKEIYSLELFQADGSQFIHPRSHFLEKEEHFKIPNQAAYQSAVIITKKPKANSHINYSKNRWYKLDNKTIDPIYADRLCATCVAVGEIYRFEIGNTEPKYRILEEKGKKFILSREVKGYIDFFDYYSNNKISCLENTGRIVFNNIFYSEDDLHSGHMGIDENGVCCSLDHDRSLAELTLKFHITSNDNSKIISYKFLDDILKKSLVTIKDPDGKKSDCYQVTGKKRNDMGHFDLLDYEKLPLIHCYLPKHWFFMSDGFLKHSLFLREQKLFQNEKHFSALKTLITKHIKFNIINTHIKNEDDRKLLQTTLSNKFQDLLMICKHSKKFKAYIAYNPIVIVKTIIYEMNEFYHKNNKYLPKNVGSLKNQWSLICKQLIDNYNELLKKVGNTILDEKEYQELMQFSSLIIENNQDAIVIVRDFYKTQQMSYHEKMASQKLSSTLKTEPAIKIEFKTSA